MQGKLSVMTPWCSNGVVSANKAQHTSKLVMWAVECIFNIQILIRIEGDTILIRIWGLDTHSTAHMTGLLVC